MYYAIQQPLDIYLYLAPQTKFVHAFVHTYVGKYRFNNGDSLGIYLTPLLGLDLFDHCLRYVIARCIHIVGKMALLRIFILQTLGSELTALAIGFVGYIPSQKLTFMPAGFAKSLQSFAIGTNIFILVTIVVKISECKLLGPWPITKPTGKSLITVAEFVVRYISVQLLLVTFVYIGDTMVA